MQNCFYPLVYFYFQRKKYVIPSWTVIIVLFLGKLKSMDSYVQFSCIIKKNVFFFLEWNIEINLSYKNSVLDKP